MTQRSNGNLRVSATDVLIAMLSSDLRGSWGGGGPVRSRAHGDPAASAPPAAAPAASAPPPAAEPAEPAATDS